MFKDRNGQAERGNLAQTARPEISRGVYPEGERGARHDGEAFAARDRDELAEHLALLARWFYSKPREGEIFFPQRGDWPYRRIIRACSRLLAPPAATDA